jgi:MFS superfamily sulfate permease-like transporter
VSIVVRSQTMANGLAILVGIFLTILGMCRFGFIDNILSKAVLRGFVTAVAFIIMIEQLPALLGIAVPKSTSSLFARWRSSRSLTTRSLARSVAAIEFAYEKLEYLYEHVDEAKYFNLGVGVASVAFLLLLSLLKRWFKWVVYVPGILILVVLGMALAYFAHLPNEEFPLLGTMPGTLSFITCSRLLQSHVLSITHASQSAGGFSLPHLPGVFSMTLHQTAHMIDAAVVISIVGFVESVVVAKEYSAKHHYQVSSNRELLALGGANIVSSFFKVRSLSLSLSAQRFVVC